MRNWTGKKLHNLNPNQLLHKSGSRAMAGNRRASVLWGHTTSSGTGARPSAAKTARRTISCPIICWAPAAGRCAWRETASARRRGRRLCHPSTQARRYAWQAMPNRRAPSIIRPMAATPRLETRAKKAQHREPLTCKKRLTLPCHKPSRHGLIAPCSSQQQSKAPLAGLTQIRCCAQRSSRRSREVRRLTLYAIHNPLQ